MVESREMVSGYWFWGERIAVVLGILGGLFTVAPPLFRWGRKLLNWYASRTQRTTIKRLELLRSQLQKLNEPSPVEEPRANLYAVVIWLLIFLSTALLAAVGFAYQRMDRVDHNEPSVLLAISVVMLMFAAGLGLWKVGYFMELIPSIRAARKKETELAISTL
jgi:hypothetical protein